MMGFRKKLLSCLRVLHNGRVQFRISPLSNQIVPLWGTSPTLGNTVFSPVTTLANSAKRHLLSQDQNTGKAKMDEFYFPNDQVFALLECSEPFNELTEKEKLYAHYFSLATWNGSLICSLQFAYESPLIVVLFNKIFKAESIAELKKKAISQCGFTEEEFTAFLIYVSAVFSNYSNYKSFGDKKFIPNLPKEKFLLLVKMSKANSAEPKKIQDLLSNCFEKIYSLSEIEKQLGFPGIGTTTYLSKNITREDREIIKEFLKKQKFELFNSRVFKTQNETGKICYEIKLASVLTKDDSESQDLVGSHLFNGHNFVITRGDYSDLLQLVNENLSKAKDYAANDNQVKMIDKYMESFRTGSLNAHKDASRVWVKDFHPTVETYIGFIEVYRDPLQLMGEFEGIVAMVNKKMSAKFDALVNNSDSILPLLPWPKDYENPCLIKPDFSSLDVLTYANPDVPLAINIPNYNEVKEKEGFKNVSLGNSLTVRAKSTEPKFMPKNDMELFKKYFISSYEVQLGLHELIGHGSGKLFRDYTDGKNHKNFDANTLDLETGEKVSTWYKDGETYYSVFGSIGSSFEECRADCVGLYLSTCSEVLRIFGIKKSEMELNMYVNWLLLLNNGLCGLEFYDPNKKSWGQAHRQAHFVILQVLLEAGGDFLQLKEVLGEDGKPDLLLTVDKSKILSIGKPAIGKFLQKLHLYRCTANINKASVMYNKYSTVNDQFNKYRDIVVARKSSKAILVQHNTVLKDGKVLLKSYEASAEGVIHSWLDRFAKIEVEDILENLAKKDKNYFV